MIPGLTPKCHKKYQELKARQIRILVKRLPFVPKSGTAKLLFDYKKAYEVLINGPREARGKDPAARLVPLVTKLSSSESSEESEELNPRFLDPVNLALDSNRVSVDFPVEAAGIRILNPPECVGSDLLGAIPGLEVDSSMDLDDTHPEWETAPCLLEAEAADSASD